MLYPALLLTVAVVCHADVSHLVDQDHTTEHAPPRPYAFAYTAGRFPGHADRHHAEVSDGSGVVRGTFSYVDPRQKVRRVDYVADKNGFHPVLSDSLSEHPQDTEAVAAAKEKHHLLYEKIAADHATNIHPLTRAQSVPLQSAAVAAATAKHASLFRVIAEQHARIAAERELQALQEQEHSESEEPNYELRE